jgi:hypothetical protein
MHRHSESCPLGKLAFMVESALYGVEYHTTLVRCSCRAAGSLLQSRTVLPARAVHLRASKESCRYSLVADA